MPSKIHNLLSKGFRRQPGTPQVSSKPTETSLPPTSPKNASSVSPVQAPATIAAAPRNLALELAIQRHLDEIPDGEKEAFRAAEKRMDENNLLSKARCLDEQHRQSSLFRPQADRLAKFLDFFNRFMGGVAIGIQSNPEISSLVVGAVRVVIDVALHFVTFFHKLTDMICQFEKYLAPLGDYAKASHNMVSLQDAVATVYGDLLKFCRKTHRIFVDAHGHKRKLTSVRIFLREQWEPFETEFGSIKANLESHLHVLQHAALASSLKMSREVERSTYLLIQYLIYYAVLRHFR